MSEPKYGVEEMISQLPTNRDDLYREVRANQTAKLNRLHHLRKHKAARIAIADLWQDAQNKSCSRDAVEWFRTEMGDET